MADTLFTNNKARGIATTHNAVARTMVRTLESYNCDSAAIFLANGLDPSATNLKEGRVAGEAMQGVWRDAVCITGDSAVGITFAESFHPGSLHGLGFSWAASTHLYEALQRLVRFFRVISTVGKVVLKEDEEYVYLWLKIPFPAGTLVDASIDGALALFISLCRFAKGEDFCAAAMEMQRPPPAAPNRFRQFFGCPITYQARENVLIFNRADLYVALPVANPALARANDQVVIEYLARLDQNNFANQVCCSIIEALPSGVPTQNQMANATQVSGRQLQRKLASEGTSFSTLVEQVRKDLATKYLKQTWRSVSEISYLLGYSEPTNFSRSFKRWTGLTPIQFQSDNAANSSDQ